MVEDLFVGLVLMVIALQYDWLIYFSDVDPSLVHCEIRQWNQCIQYCSPRVVSSFLIPTSTVSQNCSAIKGKNDDHNDPYQAVLA